MSSELHKPLGTRPPASSGTSRFKMVTGGIALIGLGAIAAFVLLIGLPTENVTPTAEPVTIAKTEVEKKPQPATLTEITQKPRERPDLPIDENAPGLEEIEPVGNVAVPVPRPQFKRAKQALAHLPDPELSEKYGSGILPKKSPDGLRPLDFYSRQADTEGNFGVARLVVIVTGLGISQTTTQEAIGKLPAGVTLAFAASGNSLKRWTRLARNEGHELLLQIPMEPYDGSNTSAGPNTLMTNLDEQTNRKLLYNSLSRMTNYVGVMNYLGGKMLATKHNLEPIVSELENRGLMFVEDGTVKNSKLSALAKTHNLPYARANMVADKIRTRATIAKNLGEMEARAKRTGLAVVVVSAFPQSIDTLNKFLKNAKQRGLEITPVSAIASR